MYAAVRRNEGNAANGHFSLPALAAGDAGKYTHHISFFKCLFVLSMNPFTRIFSGYRRYLQFGNDILNAGTAFDHQLTTETITSLGKIVP